MANDMVARVALRFLARVGEGAILYGMADVAAVRLAKESLKLQLGDPAWLRGIGIGGESGNYCVKVNVDKLTHEVRASIPTQVRGVPVLIEAVGEIRARPSSR